MADTLEQVLADVRGEAQVLRKHGDARTADVIDQVIDRVRAAAEDYITWLEESDAELRSGHVTRWLRSRFPEWEALGHARREHGRRQYRQCVVPLRANRSAAREAGRDAARELVRSTRRSA